MCSRMASLIGLFRPLAQKLDDLDHDPLAMNDFRLRVTMILLESRSVWRNTQGDAEITLTYQLGINR